MSFTSEAIYSNKRLSQQFAILILLQPFIDIYRLFVGNAVEICGISLVELFNLLMIGYLAVLFILNQRRLKSFVPAFIYGAVLLVYLALHCYNILQFDTGIITGTSISPFSEIYVILRSYVLPLMLLYMLVYIRTEENRFLNTMVMSSWIISGVIVVTNLLGVAYVCYASQLDTNEMIRQNIFSWFSGKEPDNVILLASKGWFYSGNQIGLILFMLFPLVIYAALTRRKVHLYALVLVQAVAMIMVATKTAAFGSILLMVFMLLLFIVFTFIHREFKSNWKPLVVVTLIIVGATVLLQFSPVFKMMKIQQSSYGVSDEEKENLDQFVQESTGESKTIDPSVFAEHLKESYLVYGINKDFLELFPVEDNVEFWWAVVNDPTRAHVNYRQFKGRIYQEVLKKNDNPLDRVLGIGYTSNFPYMEKDVAAQNIWFGVAGTVLFIGPYIALILLCILQGLRKFKERVTFQNCTLLMSICGGFCVSLIAGHLFGYLFPTFLFVYILAQLYQNVRDGKQKTEQISPQEG